MVYNKSNIPKGQLNRLIFEGVRAICLHNKKKIEKNKSPSPIQDPLLKIRIEAPQKNHNGK